VWLLNTLAWCVRDAYQLSEFGDLPMFCPAPRHFSGPELLARCSRIHSVLFLHSQWRNEGSRGQKRLKCVPPRFFFGGGGGKGLGSEMLCTKLATKTATVCCDRQVITFRSLIRLYHVSVFVFASRKIFSAKLSRALSFAAPEGNCSPPLMLPSVGYATVSSAVALLCVYRTLERPQNFG